MQNQVAVLGGFGGHSDFGDALINRLKDEAFRVAVFTRNIESAERLENDGVHVYRGDLTDQAFVETAIVDLEQRIGPIAVYIHNAAGLVRGAFTELVPADFENAWRAAVLSAVTVTGVLTPKMLERQHGSLMFTGATASIRGGAGFAPFAAAKFALRGLAQSMARELGPRGIHVVHVFVDGLISGRRAQHVFNAPETTCIRADDLAAQYVDLIRQPASCWTHELDLRPSEERF